MSETPEPSAEDLEHAERARREPAETRRLRRLGGAIAVGAVVLCLFGMLGDRWWSMEAGRVRIILSASDIQACDVDGACKQVTHADFIRGVVAASHNGSTAESVEAWLGGGSVTVMLGFVLVAAGFLGGMGLLSTRHKGTRVLAVTTAVIAVGAFIPVGRFFRAAPLEQFHRGVHAYLGMAGVVAAIAAALLIALPRALVTPPTARVVRRG